MTQKQLAQRLGTSERQLDYEFYGDCKECVCAGGTKMPVKCVECRPVVAITIKIEEGK